MKRYCNEIVIGFYRFCLDVIYFTGNIKKPFGRKRGTTKPNNNSKYDLFSPSFLKGMKKERLIPKFACYENKFYMIDSFLQNLSFKLPKNAPILVYCETENAMNLNLVKCSCPLSQLKKYCYKNYIVCQVI